MEIILLSHISKFVYSIRNLDYSWSSGLCFFSYSCHCCLFLQSVQRPSLPFFFASVQPSWLHIFSIACATSITAHFNSVCSICYQPSLLLCLCRSALAAAFLNILLKISRYWPRHNGEMLEDEWQTRKTILQWEDSIVKRSKYWKTYLYRSILL